MPLMTGESVFSTVCRMRRRPSARTVRFWSSAYPIGLRTRVILNSPFERDSGIFLSLPERPQVRRVFPPMSGFLADFFQVVQTAQRSSGDIEHIGTPKRLGENIAHAGGLQHRPHRTAGDNPGPGGSPLYEDLRPAEARDHLVRNGRALQGDRLHRLAGLFRRLVDGVRNAARLTHAQADVPPIVA